MVAGNQASFTGLWDGVTGSESYWQEDLASTRMI